MEDLILGVIIVVGLNVSALCVYRWFNRRKMQAALKGVVNNEVSKYFKIASNEH
jgi:hypothetical protein